MSKRAKLNTIRIIGGAWRGRRLPVIDSPGLRPTIDRVRETLFNWLVTDLIGARVLDLFAGSGALGLESMSRGAAFVQFVESNTRVAGQLQENLAVLADQPDPAKQNLRCINALSYLATPAQAPFDIVFLDPPFESDLLERTLILLVENNYLATGATVYLEQDVNNKSLNIPSEWTLHREGVAGQSAYYLYFA